MTDEIAVEPYESGVLRLFAVDLPQSEARAFLRMFDETGPSPVATALGVSALNPDYVEAFAAEDIEELGLSGYLLEGYGVTDPNLTEQAAGLDRMEGCFVVIVSAAFRGEPHTLRVGPPLRLVATFRDPPPVPRMEQISTESAEGVLETGPSATAAWRRPPVWTIGVAIVFAVAAIFVFGRG